MSTQKISVGELNSATKEIRESLADLQYLLAYLEEENPDSTTYVKMQHQILLLFRGVNRVLHLAHNVAK